MIYLLQYIFFWLLAAAGVGALLAWYLRGAILHPKLTEARTERDIEAGAAVAARAEAAKLREQAVQLRQETGVLEAAAGAWSAKAKLWDIEREKLFGELRESAGKARELESEVASWKAQSRAWEAERKTLAAQAEQADEWRSRFEDLRINAIAALATPKAMAAAAGAGAGGSAVSQPPSLVEDRFLSFVVRTQNEGWGDIERLEGLEPEHGRRLRAIGIAWVKDLSAHAGDTAGRERVAQESGLPVDLLASWARAADLLRIEGVTPEWAHALESAGVDGVAGLASRGVDELMERLDESDPAVAERVQAWIQRAAKLEPRSKH